MANEPNKPDFSNVKGGAGTTAPKADFGKWVKPQQLADVILFLISDQASAITGALIPVVGRV